MKVAPTSVPRNPKPTISHTVPPATVEHSFRIMTIALILAGDRAFILANKARSPRIFWKTDNVMLIRLKLAVVTLMLVAGQTRKWSVQFYLIDLD